MERSSTQYAPTVNIVLSYDAAAMIAFQESGDFSAFVNHRKAYDAKMKAEQGEGYVPQTHIFNNSPASTFVSLEHNMMSEDEQFLTVEILDPQGVFEESMMDNSVDSMLNIKDNPVGHEIIKRANDLVFSKSERQHLIRERALIKNKQGLGTARKLAEIDEAVAEIDDTIQELHDETEAQTDEDNESVESLNIQIKERTSQFQRPVFITYGCGDSLKDWAPVQCFGNILKLEYSFSGDGVRQFKLFFSPVGVHPNLMKGFGIKPFGTNFAKGLLTQGTSSQLFNEEASNAEADAFKKLVSASTQTVKSGAAILPDFYIDKYIRDYTKPSLHLAVKGAIENYIKNGTNYENVLVMLPNLDIWLAGYFKECVNAIKWRVYAREHTYASMGLNVDDVIYMRAFEEALNGLGLSMPEVVPEGKSSVVGSNTFGILEDCSYAADAKNWLSKRHIIAKMSCDYKTDIFMKKLIDVGQAIETKIVELENGCPKINMMKTIDVEVDFGLLQIMERAGIIPDAATPCVMWGSTTFKVNFIQAQLMESSLGEVKNQDGPITTDDEGEESLSFQNLAKFSDSKIQKFIHPIDQLLGIDVDYMKSVIDHVLPVPWIGPFGPNNSGQSDDFAIPGDTNQSTHTLSDLKRNQPYKAARMPVFTFGTRNPNVLSVDFDVNGIYLAGIGFATDQALPSQGLVAGVIPADFRSTTRLMFDKMDGVDINDVDENGVPVGFKKLVEPYYDSDWWNGDDVEGFDEWSAIFDSLGDSAYKNISDKTFTGDNAEADFYKFMWTAFQALYLKAFPTPTSTRNLPGNDPSKKTMSNSTRFTDHMVNHVMKGKISTTPLFNLASNRAALLRSCLLYCIEPRFSGSQSTGSPKANTTWFSGLYTIMGFKHSISTSEAKSTFLLAKSAGKGSKLMTNGEDLQDTGPGFSGEVEENPTDVS